MNLSVALKNNLNYLLLSSRQNVSILRIDPSLIIGLINKALRQFYDRSATEDLNSSKSMDGINIVNRIDTLSNSSNSRNDSIRTHSRNELVSSKNGSITISSDGVYNLQHIGRSKGISGNEVIAAESRTIVSSGRDKSLLNLIVNSIGKSFSDYVHDIGQNFITIEQSFKINGGSAANCVSDYREALLVKSKGLINTRKTNLSEELLSSQLTNSSLKHSSLSLRNLLNFCKLTYGTEFPRFKKVKVNGDDADPLFKFLKEQKGFAGWNMEHPIAGILDKMLTEADPNYKENPDIKWNFTKFLINKKGMVVARFEPTEKIEVIEKQIIDLL